MVLQVNPVYGAPGLTEQVAGRALRATIAGLERMTRISVAGLEQVDALPNAIFCYWHQWATPGFFAVRASGKKLASMLHPVWYLRPYRVVASLDGHKTVLGSSGRGGQHAAQAVVEELQRGYSTLICPDGPLGPDRVLKPGAVRMARQSATPLVPVTFEVTGGVFLPRWDRMWLPLPGARVQIRFGDPIIAKAGDSDATLESQLAASLL